MTNESKTTTDHKTIQKWAEVRGGKPASVKGTEKDGEAGLLRVEFPGYSNSDKLEEISWSEFFKKFDEKHLAFLYQEHTSSGEESRFFKLVSRDSAEHKLASTLHSNSHTADETHEKMHQAEHKTTDKAHKVEHKSDDKAHKTEHKSDDKVHKTEHKSDDKVHKVEHKSTDKAHKVEHKSDDKVHKTEHKSTDKAHKASTHK